MRLYKLNIYGFFVIIYLLIFFSFGLGYVEQSSFPLTSLTRLVFLFISLLIIAFYKNILINTFSREKLLFSYLILFLIIQLTQVVLTSSPLSSLVKYLYFIAFYLILTQHEKSNGLKKIQTILNSSIILFFILLLFYLYSFIQTPFNITFREIRIDFIGWNNNENAGFFAVVFPFVLFYLRKEKTLTWVFTLIFLYLFIFYNGSIGALFSLLLSVLIFHISKGGKNLFKRIYLFGILILFLFFGLQFLAKFDVIFTEGFTNVLSGKSQEGNLAGRIGGIWLPVIEFVSNKNLILGFGGNSWGQVAEKAGTYWISSSGNSGKVYVFRDAHNFFLVAFVEGGVVLLAFILTIIYKGINTVFYMISKSKDVTQKLFSASLLSSWIGLLAWFMMYNAWYSGGWYFFILLLSITFIQKENLHINKDVN